FAYDASTDNMRTITDLRGNDAVYYLNYHGNPMRIVEPLGKETITTWSIDDGLDDNVATSKTDGRGFTTTYKYDVQGNITQESGPNNKTITTEWDLKFSQPLTRTDRNGVTQSWGYDDHGNLRSHTDGDGNEYSYSYNSHGERIGGTTPRGYSTSYSYDARGNPYIITGPLGSVTDLDHDVRGRKIIETYCPSLKVSGTMKSEEVLLKLSQWIGSYATIWSYTVSHQKMVIRLEGKSTKEIAELYLGGCEHIVGPTHWNDSQFEIVSTYEDGYYTYNIIDKKVGFEVQCHLISIKVIPRMSFLKKIDPGEKNAKQELR
ncbi:MAG: RHS repeat protein, partial [Planctomycetes bacterium]|nr:RHS repeat protein [Planctomycetota bacterium]